MDVADYCHDRTLYLLQWILKQAPPAYIKNDFQRLPDMRPADVGNASGTCRTCVQRPLDGGKTKLRKASCLVVSPISIGCITYFYRSD